MATKKRPRGRPRTKPVRRRRAERLPLYNDPAYLKLLETLGRNVRALRAERDLTQEAAAERAGVTLQHWSRVEGGKTNASMLTVARIAAALGVEPVELFRVQAQPPQGRMSGGTETVSAVLPWFRGPVVDDDQDSLGLEVPVLEARRKRKVTRDAGLKYIEVAGMARRRPRCPVRGSRGDTFTTALLPQTKARLKAAHVALFALDDRLDFVVPSWLIVDAVLDDALRRPDDLFELVKNRIAALDPLPADGRARES